ncbi:hypothetical protein Save01_00751 [Streptomyces avermitilis]
MTRPWTVTTPIRPELPLTSPLASPGATPYPPRTNPLTGGVRDDRPSYRPAVVPAGRRAASAAYAPRWTLGESHVGRGQAEVLLEHQLGLGERAVDPSLPRRPRRSADIQVGVGERVAHPWHDLPALRPHLPEVAGRSVRVLHPVLEQAHREGAAAPPPKLLQLAAALGFRAEQPPGSVRPGHPGVDARSVPQGADRRGARQPGGLPAGPARCQADDALCLNTGGLRCRRERARTTSALEKPGKPRLGAQAPMARPLSRDSSAPLSPPCSHSRSRRVSP